MQCQFNWWDHGNVFLFISLLLKFLLFRFLLFFRLPDLERKREDYCSDLEKFHALIDQLNEHKLILEKKVDDSRAKLELLSRDRQLSLDSINSLNQTVKDQGMTVEDGRRMENERTRLEELAGKTSLKKQQHQKDLWEYDMEVSQKLEELDAAVLEYNSIILELQLFSSLTGAKEREKFLIVVDKNCAPSKEGRKLLGDIDLEGFVHLRLSVMMDETVSATQTLRQNLDEAAKKEKSSVQNINVQKEKLEVRTATRNALNSISEDCVIEPNIPCCCLLEIVDSWKNQRIAGRGSLARKGNPRGVALGSRQGNRVARGKGRVTSRSCCFRNGYRSFEKSVCRIGSSSTEISRRECEVQKCSFGGNFYCSCYCCRTQRWRSSKNVRASRVRREKRDRNG